MDLPKRKHPRLKDFDYSSNGAYFVTICTYNRLPLLASVADGAVLLNQLGQIAETQLLALSERYPFVQVHKYVIMPNHLHLLLQFAESTAGASPRPTLSDIVCAYKSLTARAAKQLHSGPLFQASFYEHVIRSEQEFADVCKYIEENPLKWEEDKYFM